MKAGISTCFFNRLMLTEDDFAMLAEAGVHNIELLIPQDYVPRYTDLSKKYNVVFSHRHTWMTDISTTVEYMRQAYTTMIMEDIKKFATYAAPGSEKIVVVHTSGIFEESSRAEHYKNAITSLRDITACARELGITVAIENALMPHDLGDSPEGLLRMLDDVGLDNMGICLDVGHANASRNIDKHFEVLGDKIVTFHLHDNNGKPEGIPWSRVDLHDIPGTGTVDWGKLGRNIEAIGFDGTLIFEVGFINSYEGNLKGGLEQIREYFNTYLARTQQSRTPSPL